MKRLVVLLLVLSVLFTIGCKSKDVSSMSDDEILQSISANDLYGTWKPVGEHGNKLTLSSSYAKYADQYGAWSYGDNKIRIQIGDGAAFYCNVLVKDKKIRLELDGHLFVRDEQITAHELTTENILDYFELSHIDFWQENDGAMWYSREYALTLKKEYENCFADGIEINAELTKIYYDYNIDYEAQTMEITLKDESYTEQTENSNGTTKDGKLVLLNSILKEGESYSFPTISNINITSVFGKIYII